MFQLKMYMAVSGRPPGRGLQEPEGSSPPPARPPPVQEVSVVWALPHIFLNKRSSPSSMLPSHATFKGWDTDWDCAKQPFWDWKPKGGTGPCPYSPPCPPTSLHPSQCG